MDYSFRQVGRTCAATGAALTPGSICRSALVERDGRLERRDFSAAAWTGPPEGALGHWRCRVPLPAVAKTRVFTADELLAEFERLEDAGHEQVRKLRYVLALLLLQKRRLELDDTRSEDDADYLVLVGTKGEGPFEVRDEKLPPDEIAAVQRELTAALTVGDRADETAADAVPEPRL